MASTVVRLTWSIPIHLPPFLMRLQDAHTGSLLMGHVIFFILEIIILSKLSYKLKTVK
jgi:hypothetical protein